MSSLATAEASSYRAQQSYQLEQDQDARLLDIEVQKRLVTLSQELLLHMFTLMRTLSFHEYDNDAVQHNLQRLHQAMQEIFEYEYEIHVECTGSDFLINERWSKLARRFHDVCSRLIEFLLKRGIGGLWFTAVPTPNQLLEFVTRMVKVDPDHSENPFAQVQTQLWQRGLEWVTLEKYVEYENWEAGRLGPRDTIKQTYFQAIQVVQQLHAQVQHDRPLKLKMAKRVIQSMVDIFDSPRYQDELPLLLHLTQAKKTVDYRYAHHVNVAILAMGLGKHLGLSRTLRRDLGISALLYDSGMLRLPDHLLEPHQLSAEERQAIEKHPVLAIPVLLHTSFIDSTVLRTVNTTFGHHLGAREGGYPNYGKGLTSLSPQIIALADLFDAMCTPQPYKTKTLTPTEALAELARMPDRFINPTLSRQFVNWLGPLPLGTLVRLHEGSIGYVYQFVENSPHRDRPYVKILQSRNVPAGTYVNLSQADGSGQYHWNVAEVLTTSHVELQSIYLIDLIQS
ncbi:MAG: hypothetical protein EP343_07775 [Deltaproteobacteria bacterium]|nr:MAG: hypothetical protein EP343_07775 [Deltaproteobacteria bacterium]